MMTNWIGHSDETPSAETIEKRNKEVINAKNRAVQAGRKVARMAARAENLTRTARQLGADIPNHADDKKSSGDY